MNSREFTRKISASISEIHGSDSISGSHHTHPQIIGMVTDPFQDTQGLGKDDIRFRIAESPFQALDMPLACLPVKLVEFTFHFTDFPGQQFVAALKSFDS